MKKVFGIGSCMVGIVLVISGAVMKLKGQTAVTVIGGADGSTAVFVAGKLNGDFSIMLILIGIVLLAVAAIVYWKKMAEIHKKSSSYGIGSRNGVKRRLHGREFLETDV